MIEVHSSLDQLQAQLNDLEARFQKGESKAYSLVRGQCMNWIRLISHNAGAEVHEYSA